MRFSHGVYPALRRTVDRGLHRAVRSLHRFPSWPREVRSVQVHRDIPYRPTFRRAHTLDVYCPAGPGPHPVLLHVHGGSFSMLSKDAMRFFALVYARAGYVVVSINYRLGPRHRYPAPLEDVSHALLWTLDHIQEFGGDPTQLGLVGESAGANLVTSLAYLATHRRPEPFAQLVFDRNPSIGAVLAIYGIFDLHDVERFYRDPKKARKLPRIAKLELAVSRSSYVGERPDLAPLASPLRLLTEPPRPGDRPLPPFFLTVGTADPLLDDSRRLQAALDRRGSPSELQIMVKQLHGFNAMTWTAASRAKWRAALAFLDRHLPAKAPHPPLIHQRKRARVKTTRTLVFDRHLSRAPIKSP
ncbi:MAG: alpha/beta hydrolase [Myxococcales bacterium]|nr:alpha/beta hydrolase [Myxococcales bacterium]